MSLPAGMSGFGLPSLTDVSGLQVKCNYPCSRDVTGTPLFLLLCSFSGKKQQEITFPLGYGRTWYQRYPPPERTGTRDTGL